MSKTGESRAKYWIAGRLGMSTQGLRDADLCMIVQEKTGLPLPEKRHRKAYLLAYWNTISGLPRVATTDRPPKARKPRVIAKAFYQSDEWRAVRYEALKLHGARCQCCGISPKEGAIMHVDHIKPRSKFPDLALVLANLQILCEGCNLGKMARDQTDWRPIVSESPEGAEEHLRSLSE